MPVPAVFHDHFMKDLPAEPNAAIIAFAQRVSDWIEQPYEEGDEDVWVAIKHFYLRFIGRFGLKIPIVEEDTLSPSDWIKVQTLQVLKFREKVIEAETAAEVLDVINKLEARMSEETFGLARLNDEEKKKIHAQLRKIRSIIESSDIAIRKKNILFERLNDLAREVDLHGTRTDRFFAFASDIAFAIGDATKKAKPLFDEVKDMLKIVSRSRARQEGVSLPPGDETLSLPKPPAESSGLNP